MDKIIEALQFVLNTIGVGTKTIGQVGKGTESYGISEQAFAAGTDSFVGAFKTIFNFIAGIFNFGTVA